MPALNSLLDHKVLGREFKKGLAQGREQGRAEGEVKLQRRQLEYRFKKLPKWAAGKLANGNTRSDRSVARRLLEKKSLAAVCGED